MSIKYLLMKRNAIIGMMVGFALVISGCSGDAGGSGETINGIPESAVGADWDDLSYEQLMEMREKQLQDLRDIYLSDLNMSEVIGNFPDVPLERFIHMSEVPTVMVECLSEMGYNVRPNSIGYVFLDSEEVLETKITFLILIFARLNIPSIQGLRLVSSHAPALSNFTITMLMNCRNV